MMPYWLVQAVALLNQNEVSLLLGGMAFLWASLAGACAFIWKIGTNWVTKVNTEIAAIQKDLAQVPVWIAEALERHNVEDIKRYQEVLSAIAKQGNVMTEPLTRMQMTQADHKERIEALEDTPPLGVAERRQRHKQHKDK